MKYRIEIQPPDIKPYRKGNAGVDYVHVLDSGKPGPNVMVQALTHGNEFCGAIALDYLFKQQIKAGQGQAGAGIRQRRCLRALRLRRPGPLALHRRGLQPRLGRRVILGKRDSAELRRARELRPFVDAADYLLDLHTMTEPCRPIMVCGMLDKGAEFARKVGVPADLLIDTGHPQACACATAAASAIRKVRRTRCSIEAGQHWEKSAVDVAIDTTLRFLKVTGTVDPAWVDRG
jgi:predicted deacylase